MARVQAGLLDPTMLWKSLPDALRKLDPRTLYKNPVMLIVELGALFTTVIAKPGNMAEPPLPSVTLITMLLVVPAEAAVGAPDSAPVLVLNVAHDGLPVWLNVNVSPSGSLAAGVNEYAAPAVTCVAAVPEIVGALFAIVIAKAGKEADPPLPSATSLLSPSALPVAR